MSLSATAVKRGSGNVPSTSFSTITGERNAERQSRDTCAWLMPSMSPISCLFLYVPDESISIIHLPRPGEADDDRHVLGIDEVAVLVLGDKHLPLRDRPQIARSRKLDYPLALGSALETSFSAAMSM